tara:strand:+ start:12998 stop:14110 length:1113 start_codon:yes stop_codon:yes gene_type:complete
MEISEFKSHFFYSKEHCNLNNAGQALIPDVNQKIATQWLERFYKEGAACSMAGWAQTEVVREKLAKFLGADVNELAYFQTTASALSQAAFGIPLQEEDEILTWDQEYPSNFYPWRMAAQNAGANVIQMKSTHWQTPTETILASVTSKTKVIAISWVQYSTGAVSDLAAISKAVKGKGIWLVADIIQGAGVRPFNFKECGFDIVCGGSHKWLCSSYGGGYMLIKKERLLDITPIELGAMTYGDPDTVKSFTSEPKKTPHRFEPGSKAMIEVNAMGATIDLFSEFGIENIYKEASRLADRLRDGIKSAGGELFCAGGPIVNFKFSTPEKQKDIETRLTSARIAYAKRGPGVRLSPHAYNKDEEIDLVLNLLK